MTPRSEEEGAQKPVMTARRNQIIRTVLNVSTGLAAIGAIGMIFAFGFMTGSAAEQGNSPAAAVQEAGSEYRASVPACSLMITGGGFDTAHDDPEQAAKMAAALVDRGTGPGCAPDKYGVWTDTLTIKNTEKTPVTYTLTAAITEEGNIWQIGAVAESKAVSIDLQPGETRKVTLSDFRYGAGSSVPSGSYRR